MTTVAPRLVLFGLALLTPLVGLFAIGLGQLSLGPTDVVRTLWDGPTSIVTEGLATTVVWQLRVPRVLVGLCVGAILAASGAALQAIVRNDLADPYLLGVSSGASFGAAVVLASGIGVVGAVVGAAGGAFLGALAALALVLVILGNRQLSSSRLVLAGLTVGYFLSALTNLVVALSDQRDAVRAIMFWMLGSLGKSSWDQVPLVLIVTVLATALLLLWGRRLDAIGLGDDVARSLGVDPLRVRRSVAIVVAIAVAAAVSVSGAIGFVGLVIPHLARQLVGATHRLLIPASALLGASVLVLADALARTVLAPREIPLGILTALVGTPLLMYMLHRRRQQLN
ncbi:FecCD family ABC transporter permease [Micrococcoides hystricis]|uniref:FecCD family ABC transporter permease n=1 Tax=Micrococcoides hystricis TaxID=1572761 RepID=A0ABV6PCY1_9MICC